MRVGEDELLDAIARIGAHPLSDHAAHRQPAPTELLAPAASATASASPPSMSIE
jgi:hypothetical protein